MKTGRAKVLLTLAAMIAVTLAGCSATGAPVTVERPSWQSGYAWSYAYEEGWDYQYSENGEDDNYTDSESGRIIRQVANTTQKAGDEPVYVMVEQESDRKYGRLAAVSQIDLGDVWFGYGYSSSCSNTDCTGELEIDWDEEEDIFPPYLDFPLTTGKTWGGIVDLSDSDDGDFSISYGAAVEGAAIVELPTGPVTAAKVTILVRPTNAAEMTAAIREEAASEGYKVDALEIFYEERETIYFSAEHQAIVKRDFVSAERTYARGTDPDGEPFEFRGEGSYQRSEMLDGVRLAPMPETPLDQLLPYLAGKTQILDPLNETVSDATYAIKMTPRSATINAGEAEVATYRVALDGVDALPEGHAIKWQVKDMAGRVVQNGAGMAFEAQVADPGRYTVSVQAKDGESLVSADGGSLTADWIKTTRLSCGPATVLGVPACDRGSFPMAPGIQSLTVRGVPTGPLGALAGSAMTVYDSFGQPIAGSADGDGYKVEVTDFSQYLIDGDWEMQYRHNVGVASDVDMEVTAIYGTPSQISVSVGERAPHLRSLERMPW